MKILLLPLLIALPLLAQELIPTQAAAEKPPAQIVADTLVDGVNSGLQDRIARFRNLWETLWENPRATPPEILAALGTNGVRVFQAAGAARADLDAIAAIAGTTTEALLGDAKYLTPKLPVVFSADGTVSLAP